MEGHPTQLPTLLCPKFKKVVTGAVTSDLLVTAASDSEALLGRQSGLPSSSHPTCPLCPSLTSKQSSQKQSSSWKLDPDASVSDFRLPSFRGPNRATSVLQTQKFMAIRPCPHSLSLTHLSSHTFICSLAHSFAHSFVHSLVLSLLPCFPPHLFCSFIARCICAGVKVGTLKYSWLGR